ncbi:MAG: rhomboid family intramembrane serine protease [Candidatus Bathyarchaeota archaeon]|nr:rhomboid family intramembrane serine protease [Candidatus Bathyarchaeota archaeon]MCX8177468.1 rhomboid family intramembrane serine protease [Candidatus Bathyarchaeota archaeon]MDW8194135.1 rhomboid family intramembrane serine protease [Nitrososphaerota archaeon]
MYSSRILREITVTLLIAIANLLVYAYTSLAGGDFLVTSDFALLSYGQLNHSVLNGEYWRLFTAMFIHTNIVHLLGNIFFLIVFGLRAEELFSKAEYLAIYFLSGLTGNILTLALGPTVLSAGASGAIFGIFGACTIFIRRTLGQSLFGALLYAFFLLTITGTTPNVNILAHFGGLIAGLILGYVFSSKREHNATYRLLH